MGSTDSLAVLARPLLAQVGLDLWDIEMGPALVRILVDRAEGVDLDALSAAAGALSPLLDGRDDLVPEGRYDLEVSSPGIERTLRTVEQYRRYVGSLLALKTSVPVNGARRFRATLLGVVHGAIDIMVEGSSETVTVALEQIDRAHTVVEWGPKATPRAKKGKKPGDTTQPSRSSRSEPSTEAAGSGANDKDSAS